MAYSYDKINLYDLIETISEHFKGLKMSNSFSTSKSIIDKLCKALENDFGTISSFADSIYKYRTECIIKGNTPMIMNKIIAAVSKEEKCSSLYKFCQIIHSEVKKNNIEHLYEELYKNCSFINLGKEYETIRRNFTNFSEDDDTYIEFLYILFKHAFICYKTNLPNICAKRVYEEALTYGSNDSRINTFKQAADISDGKVSCEAAFHYANALLEKQKCIDKNIYEYFCKAAKYHPGALWKIGYLCEHKELNIVETNEFLNEISQIKYTYSKNFNIKDIYQNNNRQYSFNNEYTRIAFAIYTFLAADSDLESEISKAHNSIGKLLLSGRVTIPKKSDTALKMGADYIKKAISLGNTSAIINYIYYNIDNCVDNNSAEMIEILNTVADYDPEAYRIIGDYHFNNKQFSQAIIAYKSALNNGIWNEGRIYAKLAGIYKLLKQTELAEEAYNNAIKNNNIDAAIELADNYYFNKEDMVSALELINRYRGFLSEQASEKATALEKQILHKMQS